MHRWSGATGCLFGMLCKCQPRIDDLRIHFTPGCSCREQSFVYALYVWLVGYLLPEK